MPVTKYINRSIIYLASWVIIFIIYLLYIFTHVEEARQANLHANKKYNHLHHHLWKRSILVNCKLVINKLIWVNTRTTKARPCSDAWYLWTLRKLWGPIQFVSLVKMQFFSILAPEKCLKLIFEAFDTCIFNNFLPTPALCKNHSAKSMEFVSFVTKCKFIVSWVLKK